MSNRIIYLKRVGYANPFEISSKEEYESIVTSRIGTYPNYDSKIIESLTIDIFYFKIDYNENFINFDLACMTTSNQDQLRSLIKKHFRGKRINTILNG